MMAHSTRVRDAITWLGQKLTARTEKKKQSANELGREKGWETASGRCLGVQTNPSVLPMF